MTPEKLKRANEIVGSIKFNTEQVKKLNDTKSCSKSEFKIGVINHSYKIPTKILDTVLLLIENEYEKEIENLEKEFKEL